MLVLFSLLCVLGWSKGLSFSGQVFGCLFRVVQVFWTGFFFDMLCSVEGLVCFLVLLRVATLVALLLNIFSFLTYQKKKKFVLMKKMLAPLKY